MPHASKARSSGRRVRPKVTASASGARYTVGLGASLANQVERFAKANDSSMSKAIATLVRIGLEGQKQRKREFFKKMRANLADADPGKEDELVDEFRSLILGH